MTAERAIAFLEDDAVRQAREAVLRLTARWWAFVGAPPRGRRGWP